MSEKQLEPCTLEEATHVEMGGKVYELGIRLNDDDDSENRVAKHNSLYIEVCTKLFGWQLINSAAFPILGIKTFKEVKPEPVVFEATFVKYDGEWHRLFSLHGLKHVGCKEAKFRCVEIVEED